MRSPKAVFILFHVDRPFMGMDDSSNTFAMKKFTYEQVRPFLEAKTNDETKQSKVTCNWLFLGIEYEKTEKGKLDSKSDGGEVWSIRSPYAHIDDYYNREEFRSWFAIDTSGFDEDADKIAKLFGSESGKFYEGNFLRMMAIQDVFESSVIAQVMQKFDSTFIRRILENF